MAGCGDTEIGEIRVASGRRAGPGGSAMVVCPPLAENPWPPRRRAGHPGGPCIPAGTFGVKPLSTARGCVIDATARPPKKKAVRHLVEGRRVAEPAHAYGGLELRHHLVGHITEQRVLLGVARIDETEQQIGRRGKPGTPRGRSIRSRAGRVPVGVEATDPATAPVPGRWRKKRTSCAKRRRSCLRVIGLAIRRRAWWSAVLRKNCVTSVSSSSSKVLRSK